MHAEGALIEEAAEAKLKFRTPHDKRQADKAAGKGPHRQGLSPQARRLHDNARGWSAMSQTLPEQV